MRLDQKSCQILEITEQGTNQADFKGAENTDIKKLELEMAKEWADNFLKISKLEVKIKELQNKLEKQQQQKTLHSRENRHIYKNKSTQIRCKTL